MKIGLVARELDVPVPTIRRWCLEFGPGLSPSGRGGDGRPRDFSARDLRLLRRVKTLMATPEMTFARARRELKVEGLLTAAGEAPAGASGLASGGERAARRAAEEALRPIVERLAAFEARLGRLEEGFATLQQRLAEIDRLVADLRPPDAPTPRRRWPFSS